MPPLLALAATAALGAIPAAATELSENYHALWRDPAIVRRIDDGIRQHRMSEVVLKFTDAGGRPLTGVDVQVEQTRHDFLFGANIFMLGGFPTAELNRRYETAYRSLFNSATVPFYWSDLEPEPGKPRFAKDSPPIYRRPPPDAVVEFCQQHGLTMKGHPLAWHQWYPKWRPDDPEEVMRLLDRRIAEIATRYAGAIPRWEVVNEPLERHLHADQWCNLPDDYLVRALRSAAKHFPAGTRLMLNEATRFSWLEFNEEQSPYYRLIREMLDHGERVDEFGMQLHIFSKQAWKPVTTAERFAPAHLFKVLDRYADFERPMHITELTIPAWPDVPDGQEDQATVARNFYRLWFSHPRVVGISWWNLVDGSAAGPENKGNAGLLRSDFSAKPAFTALDRLINHDWKTKLALATGLRAEAGFRGFHGEYRYTARTVGGTREGVFHVKRGEHNVFDISIPVAHGIP